MGKGKPKMNHRREMAAKVGEGVSALFDKGQSDVISGHAASSYTMHREVSMPAF